MFKWLYTLAVSDNLQVVITLNIQKHVFLIPRAYQKLSYFTLSSPGEFSLSVQPAVTCGNLRQLVFLLLDHRMSILHLIFQHVSLQLQPPYDYAQNIKLKYTPTKNSKFIHFLYSQKRPLFCPWKGYRRYLCEGYAPNSFCLIFSLPLSVFLSFHDTFWLLFL